MTESELQTQVADYIRLRYPKVLFHSDFGSGIKLTMGQAIKQKRQNGGRRAWPDMFIAEPKKIKANGYAARLYNGLFIELKKEGTKIRKKNGELVANEHIREQAKILEELHERGYAAAFAVGFDDAKTFIDWYLR
jgi:hypothetical protein